MAFPVRSVILPTSLGGQSNGRLKPALLVSTPGQAGGPTIKLVEPATRAWRALSDRAARAGHILKATSLYDSYRPYSVQESTFRTRYTTTNLGGPPDAFWNGVRWWLRAGYATAAVPGESNHGFGIALDLGEEKDGDSGVEAIDADTVRWLVANEEMFGFSHELQTEPWHIRYFRGDAIPAAVLAYERNLMEFTMQDHARLFNTAEIIGRLAQGEDSIPAGKLLSDTGVPSKVPYDLTGYYERIAREVGNTTGGGGLVNHRHSTPAGTTGDPVAEGEI